MRFIDMHCDTLHVGLLKKGAEASLFELPEAMLDFERMKKGGSLAQFFAVWIIPERLYKEGYHIDPIPNDEYVEGCVHIFNENVKAHGDMIAKAVSAEDILDNQKKGLMSAVLTIEDCCILDSKIENIDRLYDMGFRAMGLIWNHKNCLASPNSKDPQVMQEGLTAFGREAVVYMQEKGILVDVSHLSDGGFYDVANLAKKPFAATHSNCRALSPHQRNLTDDMIRVLAEHGGVTGINFCPAFLNEDASDDRSRIACMIAMMKHLKDVGGIDVIGIGTDFDGISGELEIADVSQMPKLIDAMEAAGFTSGEIDKITKDNVLRVLRDAL